MREELVSPVPTLQVGRARKLHRPRVLIENNRVVIRTACGIDPTAEGFTETIGFVSCEECS
jgi:hypothetical protein